MKVALVVKASDGTQARDDRNMGYWSYPVPEFEWQHFVYGGKRAYATPMNDDFDVIFQEDAGPYQFKDVQKPLVYLAIDSTLSADHLESRLKRAKGADLILVDQDDLERFADLGAPVHRFNYCVNDQLFRDDVRERYLDLSFYCGSNEERGQIRQNLREYCVRYGITFATGTLHPVQYAKAMAASKIVLNWPRTPANRPHRVFDAMACGACLVSGPFPEIEGDNLMAGRDYVRVQKAEDIGPVVRDLLASGEWQQIAANGKKRVMRYHTWSIRAKQLKQLLKEELCL